MVLACKINKGVVHLKKRSEIREEFTWNLKDLYENQNSWEKDLKEIENLSKKIASNRGNITKSAQNLIETLKMMDQLGIKLDRAGSYSRMAFDVDMGNSQSKNNYETIDNLFTRISDQLAFYEPELLTLEPETFQKYVAEKKELKTYEFMFEKLFKLKEHVLSMEEEILLSRMDSLGGSFRKIFDDITVNDMDFPEIEGDKGEKVIANEVNYRKMLTSYNRSLRESYFKGLLGTYGAHINSLASSTYGNVKYHAFLAKSRKYKSSREMALTQNHIPLDVYDTLINTVRSNVHILQKYLDLRKKTLKYKDLHFYDLFVPLTQNSQQTYTYENAQEILFDALKILGEDYINVLKTAFKDRWVDLYPNKGKASGAYANGVFGVHPYSLLNFTGTLEDIFTMAHELGHVMHSYHSNISQPFVDSQYVIFTAEVASTVNEYILYRYLLNKANTKEEKAYLLSLHLDSVRSTLYRQTFFADFEMQMHAMAENNVPLTPETLCETYKKLYQHYHGSDFVIDKELEYEWARIPHFYNSFYVYQYATGISAAIALAKNIINGEEKALPKYLGFLQKGGSDYPINILRDAGVDMTTSSPILAALEDFSETLELLKENLPN